MNETLQKLSGYVPFSQSKIDLFDESNHELSKKELDEAIKLSGYTKKDKSRFKDGWFFTGDLATINSEGYVTIVDRKDDLIITGGENVYSIEVENILYDNPNVMEVAVIGLPDNVWGERITGIVVLKPESNRKPSENELIGFCKQHLPGFKVPKNIIFMDELPKTGSRKISKKKLRELFNHI